MIKDKEKVAYILALAPEYITSFVINEIEGLNHTGMDITIFGTQKSDFEHNKNKRDWFSEIIYADPPYSASIILSHLYFMILSPLIYFKLLYHHKEYGGKRVFWEGVYFSRIIQRRKIRHVHAHFAWNAADVARVIKRLACISYSFTGHQSDIHRKVQRLEVKLKEAQFVITCTEGNKKYIINKYGKEIEKKIHCVYHGVDLFLFKPEKMRGNKEIDIISVGNLDSNKIKGNVIKLKGFDYLVDACRILNEKKKLNHCVLIGEGDGQHAFQQTIDEYGLKEKMLIHGKLTQKELVEMYAKAKIFVLPVVVINDSPHGIPNVIAEAMAMGLPVVATNVPHIPELIENGKDGLLVPDKNAQALSDSIEMLLSDEGLRNEIGKNARKKIVNHFDSKKHILKIRSLFEEVI